jgi:uncharacterized membrane protein YsdA (DUF1294 family)
MCYFTFFGVLAAILTSGAYALLFEVFAGWHPYLIWLVAINAVTPVLYGFDRWMGRQDRVETPETIMHLLSAAGGFVGSWLGRALFRYEVDMEERPWAHTVLMMSVIGHGVLVYQWLIKGL